MKKKTILLANLLLISSLGVLSSCGNQSHTSSSITQSNELSISVSGPSQVEVGASVQLSISVLNDNDRLGFSATSSDDSIATVDGTGVVTGVKPGNVTITITSRKDVNVKRDISLAVIGSSIPTLKITAATDTIILGPAASLSLTAEVENAGKYDVRYEWSNKYVNAGILDYAVGTLTSNGTKDQRYFAFNAGTDVITLKAYIGPYCLTQDFNIYIKNVTETFKKISTKQDVLDFINSGANSDNYVLTTDIDMEGAIIKQTENNLVFSGTLDGAGHTIKNFVVAEGKNNSNGGLISEITSEGKVYNLGIESEINEQGSVWGSAGFANVCNGVIQNCSFTIDHSFDTSTKLDENYWFPFVAGVYGTGDPVVRDCVVEIKDTAGMATIYADTCYPGGGFSSDHPKKGEVTNFYTNSTVVGGQLWDWGAPITDLSGYRTGIDFTNSKKGIYQLNTKVWNLVDNQKPTLISQN